LPPLVFPAGAIIRDERIVVHPSRENGKVTKAKIIPFLYFPHKDVPNLVLNRKDPLWRICRKVARISQQANCSCVTNFNRLCKFVSVFKTSCCRLSPSRLLRLILICPVFCKEPVKCHPKLHFYFQFSRLFSRLLSRLFSRLFLTILFAGPKRGYWAERKEANYLVINFQLSPSLRMY